MRDQVFFWSLAISLLIHVAGIPLMSPMFYREAYVIQKIPIELVELAPSLPSETAKPPHKKQKVALPRLLSKPSANERRALPRAEVIRDEIQEPKAEPASPFPDTASLAERERADDQHTETVSSVGGARLFEKGDGDARTSRGVGGSDGGGAGISGGRISSFAHPLGGYQVKPHYPDSARRAGAQGVTLLKLRVLENGKVAEMKIEKSSGHHDLDSAAVEAVRKWLFEPARSGRDPVAIWVLIPVTFELQ
jgi:protein TonB